MRTIPQSFVLRAAVMVAIVATLCAAFVLVNRDGASSTPGRAFAIEGGDARVVTAFAYPVNDTGAFQIYVTAAGKEDAIPVGAPAQFVAVRVSPDGSRLAALARPGGSEARLSIFDLASLREVSTSVRENAAPAFVAWSSDSSLVAVVGAGALIFDRDGTSIADSGVTTRVSAQGGRGTTGGGWAWTQDGSHFVTIANGVLSIFATGTERFVSITSQDLSGDGEVQRLFFTGWTPENEAFVGYQVGNTVYTRLVTSHGEIVPAAAGAVEYIAVARGAALESEAAARDNGSSGFGIVRSINATGPGLDIVEMRSESQTELLVVRNGDVVQRVKGLGLMTWGGWLYDSGVQD